MPTDATAFQRFTLLACLWAVLILFGLGVAATDLPWWSKAICGIGCAMIFVGLVDLTRKHR